MRLIRIVTPLLAASLLVTVADGCSPGTANQIIKSVIDVAVAACINEHTEIEDVAVLRETCKWTDEMAPHVKDLLSARQKGLTKARQLSAPQCDGGK